MWWELRDQKYGCGLGKFDTKKEALTAVRAMLRRHGGTAVNLIMLTQHWIPLGEAQERIPGNGAVVAAGQDLALLVIED